MQVCLKKVQACQKSRSCVVDPGQQPLLGQASDAHQQAVQPQAMAEEEDEDDYDPYAPLDPNEKGTLPIKPFKKGRKPSRRRKKQAGYQQQEHTGRAVWSSF